MIFTLLKQLLFYPPNSCWLFNNVDKIIPLNSLLCAKKLQIVNILSIDQNVYQPCIQSILNIIIIQWDGRCSVNWVIGCTSSVLNINVEKNIYTDSVPQLFVSKLHIFIQVHQSWTLCTLHISINASILWKILLSLFIKNY